MRFLRSTMAPLLLASLLTSVPSFAMQDSSAPGATAPKTDSQKKQEKAEKKQLKENQKADKAKANAAKQQQKAMEAQDKAAKDSQKATANH